MTLAWKHSSVGHADLAQTLYWYPPAGTDPRRMNELTARTSIHENEKAHLRDLR